MLIGWAVFGVILGAIGSRILREKKPRLVGKVEGAAKRFVDSFCSGEAGDKKAKSDEEQGIEGPPA